jgi:hypothetical protein
VSTLLLFNVIILEFLEPNKARKKGRIQIEKEEDNLSLFVDKKILYIKTLKITQKS